VPSASSLQNKALLARARCFVLVLELIGVLSCLIDAAESKEREGLDLQALPEVFSRLCGLARTHCPLACRHGRNEIP
jgi:hypothetical protein